MRRILICLAACVASCGNGGKGIPPVIPENKPGNGTGNGTGTGTTEVFNDLGFEPHKEGEPFNTYKGLVMTGYQGWFGGPAVDANTSFGGEQWYHYREGGMFKPGVLQNSIDMWPDMTEYTKKYTPGVDGQTSSNTPTSKFMRPDGKPAEVYSAWDESTVMLHFRWMKEYGVDGAFMQRFVSETVNNPNNARHFNRVLEHAMKASNEYQRAICVMYDLGGFMGLPSRGVADVLADAQQILDKYALMDRTKQKYYLYHNEKPLIVLWGVGFSDGRAYTPSDIQQLIDGLKAKGFSIMLGVPTFWREGKNDAIAASQLHPLIKSADIIMPWLVGRFGDHNYESSNFASMIKPDIKWCDDNGVDYAPLCYPGSSDRNMHPKNSLNPRNGGRFYWKQIHNCIKSGAKMLYIAMFDEIDEGTAIYKCLNQKDVPSNVAETSYWVYYQDKVGYRKVAKESDIPAAATWRSSPDELKKIPFTGIEDNLKTDHYLWLTGQARLMLRGEIKMQSTQPAR